MSDQFQVPARFIKLAPEPPIGKLTSEYLTQLILHFWYHYVSVLTRQDCVGCAIAYCFMYFIPRGTTVDKSSPIPRQVVDEFVRLVPDYMANVGFMPTLAYPMPLLPEIPFRLWREWATVFDPTKKPTGLREETLQRLWAKEIMPDISHEDETRAMEKAAKLAKIPLDGDEVRSELWNELPAKALYRHTDGSYKFDPRAIKDELRRPERRDRLGPITSKVKVKERDPEGHAKEKIIRKKAQSRDAMTDDGSYDLSENRSTDPADAAEAAELSRLVQAISDEGRSKGYAIDAAIARRESQGKENRKTISERFGVSVEALRYAENWLLDRLRKLAR